jgi:hypothetical protein
MKAAITQKLRTFRSELPASIYFYIGGCLFFLAFAKFGMAGWKKVYYVWSFSKDFLFIYTIYLLKPKLKSDLSPILFFAAIRCIWEIIATSTDLQVNSKIIVDYLFYLLVTILILQLINRLRKKWK